MSLIRNILLGTAVTATLTGCATSHFNPQQVKTPNYNQANNIELYADLVQKDDEWVFNNISPNISGSSKRLTLGSYRINSSGRFAPHTEKCSKSLWLDAEPCSDSEFVELSFDPMTIAAAAILPFFWVPFGMPIFFEQSFDWDEYHDAIEAAKIAGDYDSQFPGVYNNYANLVTSINYNPINKYTQKILATKYDNYELELIELVESQLIIKVTDKSGLDETYDSDAIYMSNGLSTSVQFEKIADVPAPLIKEKLALSNVTSGQSLDDLNAQIASALQKLNEIRRDNDKINQNNKAIFTRAQHKMDKKNAEVTLIMSPVFKKQFGDANVTVEYSKRTALKNGLLPKDFYIPVTITSKQFKDVLPQKFDSRNDDISIVLNGNTIKVTNHTNNFITLEATSLYHKSQILTKRDLNREIPPNAVITLSIRDFNLSQLDNDYPYMTAEKARKENINFGFALKYRKTGIASLESLYQTRKYNLFDLIK